MPMVKKGADTTVQEPPKKESGVDAAVDRLTKMTSEVPNAKIMSEIAKTASETKKEYSPRSYASDDARGKTRCVTWNAAVMSPSLAGMKWKTTEDFLKHVKRIADAGVNYSFDEKIEGI